MELKEAIEKLKNKVNEWNKYKNENVISNMELVQEIDDENIAIDTVLEELNNLQKEKEEYRIGWCNEGKKCEKLLEELNNRIPIKKIKKVLEELDERVLYPDKCNYYARLTVSEALSLKHFIENEILNKE